jgi:hypothetical protein
MAGLCVGKAAAVSSRMYYNTPFGGRFMPCDCYTGRTSTSSTTESSVTDIIAATIPHYGQNRDCSRDRVFGRDQISRWNDRHA